MDDVAGHTLVSDDNLLTQWARFVDFRTLYVNGLAQTSCRIRAVVLSEPFIAARLEYEADSCFLSKVYPWDMVANVLSVPGTSRTCSPALLRFMRLLEEWKAKLASGERKVVMDFLSQRGSRFTRGDGTTSFKKKKKKRNHKKPKSKEPDFSFVEQCLKVGLLLPPDYMYIRTCFRSWGKHQDGLYIQPEPGKRPYCWQHV